MKDLRKRSNVLTPCDDVLGFELLIRSFSVQQVNHKLTQTDNYMPGVQTGSTTDHLNTRLVFPHELQSCCCLFSARYVHNVNSIFFFVVL